MIEPFKLDKYLVDIRSDWSVALRKRQPGPPGRIDGMTLGYQELTGDAPHDGEVHRDGDELLIVVSGSVAVHFDSQRDPCVLKAGEGCVVPKDEWHKVVLLENPSRFIHVTPGPRGEHR